MAPSETAAAGAVTPRTWRPGDVQAEFARWQAAEPAVLGRMLITVLASGTSCMASLSERGGSGWRKVASSSPTSRRDFASVRSTPPMVTPMATRFAVPNRLTRTGMSDGVPG